MLQYVSGGKWGCLRRPLEAMTRTIWLVRLMFVPIISLEASVSVGRFPTAGAVAEALEDDA